MTVVLVTAGGAGGLDRTLIDGELPGPLVGVLVGFDAQAAFGALEGWSGDAGGLGFGGDLVGGQGAVGEEVHE